MLKHPRVYDDGVHMRKLSLVFSSKHPMHLSFRLSLSTGLMDEVFLYFYIVSILYFIQNYVVYGSTCVQMRCGLRNDEMRVSCRW